MDRDSCFDVCVVCAIPEEAEAFINVVSRQCSVQFERGFSHTTSHEYHYTTIRNNKRELLTIHLSCMPKPGPSETALHFKPILQEFQPCFAAMTGMCAGDKRRVRLGDLVVADRAFLYDNGKFTMNEDGQRAYLQDTDTWHADTETLQIVQMFHAWESAVVELPRPLSKRQQREWLLTKLLEAATPSVDDIQRQELEEFAPNWRKIVQELQDGTSPYLTKERTLADRKRVEELCYSVATFPFKDPPRPICHIAPIASGSAVRSDDYFKEVQIPIRGTAAIDMEGATFYRTVAEFPGLRSLLVKGVCDYADSDKDDTYHHYASSASAAYLLCFIQQFITTDRLPRLWRETRQWAPALPIPAGPLSSPVNIIAKNKGIAIQTMYGDVNQLNGVSLRDGE